MISLPNGMDVAFHKSRSIRLTTNVLRQLSSQDRRACGLVSITISQARRGLIISPSLVINACTCTTASVYYRYSGAGTRGDNTRPSPTHPDGEKRTCRITHLRQTMAPDQESSHQ